MKHLFLIALLALLINTNAQEKGDLDYVFTSMSEANERPEIVYHLSLQKKKIIEFPKNLERFKNLISLDLSKNKISLIPAEIKLLISLERLNLSRNKIYSMDQD
jgi:Leucine-rich repeat (LRR) protein